MTPRKDARILNPCHRAVGHNSHTNCRLNQNSYYTTQNVHLQLCIKNSKFYMASAAHIVQLHKHSLPQTFGHMGNILNAAATQASSTFLMTSDDVATAVTAATPYHDPLLQW